MARKTLSCVELEEIESLISKGVSLNDMAKILDRSKTTIYYHFRKIRGKTISPVEVRLKDDVLLGEFIGLFAGDGSYYKMPNYKYTIRLHFNKTEDNYVRLLIDQVLVHLFGKPPMIFQQENRINLCYYSKNIYSLILDFLKWNSNEPKTYSVGLRTFNHSRNFYIGFVRGSVDSDGHISPKSISFATVSPELKCSIEFALTSLEFDFRTHLYKEKRMNRRDIYHISLFSKDFERFHDVVGPRNLQGLKMHRPGFEFPNASP